MDDDQQFCLRWNNHQSTLISVFDTLLENGTLVDCTLAAEGKFLKAHKVVLCACSPYFAVIILQFYYKLILSQTIFLQIFPLLLAIELNNDKIFFIDFYSNFNSHYYRSNMTNIPFSYLKMLNFKNLEP